MTMELSASACAVSPRKREKSYPKCPKHRAETFRECELPRSEHRCCFRSIVSVPAAGNGGDADGDGDGDGGNGGERCSVGWRAKWSAESATPGVSPHRSTPTVAAAAAADVAYTRADTRATSPAVRTAALPVSRTRRVLPSWPTNSGTTLIPTTGSSLPARRRTTYSNPSPSLPPCRRYRRRRRSHSLRPGVECPKGSESYDLS